MAEAWGLDDIWAEFACRESEAIPFQRPYTAEDLREISQLSYERGVEDGRRSAPSDGYVTISRDDAEQAEALLGGFMGSISSYEKVEALRARLRETLSESNP